MQANGRELEEYLIQAQRAEHAAAKFAPSSHYRETWRRIAEGYRQLAREAPANGPEVTD